MMMKIIKPQNLHTANVVSGSENESKNEKKKKKNKHENEK
jgi:hypothetical protein